LAELAGNFSFSFGHKFSPHFRYKRPKRQSRPCYLNILVENWFEEEILSKKFFFRNLEIEILVQIDAFNRRNFGQKWNFNSRVKIPYKNVIAAYCFTCELKFHSCPKLRSIKIYQFGPKFRKKFQFLKTMKNFVLREQKYRMKNGNFHPRTFLVH